MPIFQKYQRSALLLLSTLVAPLAWATSKVSYEYNFIRQEALKAAREGNLDVIRKLCQHTSNGAQLDLNTPVDAEGYSLLIIASKQKHFNVVRELLKNDTINIYAKDNSYNTALIYAAKNGHLDIVKRLLKMHADWKRKKYLDENKCTETMQKLFKHDFNIHEMDKYCEELLIHAARDGYIDIVKLLLKNACNINYTARFGRTALMDSIFYGYPEIARLLIEQGADATPEENRGQTALDIALENNHMDITQLLRGCERFDGFAQAYFSNVQLYEKSKSLYGTDLNSNQSYELLVLRTQLTNQKDGLKVPLHDVLLEELPNMPIFIRLRTAFYDMVMEYIEHQNPESTQEILETFEKQLRTWLSQNAMSERQAQICRNLFTLDNIKNIKMLEVPEE